MSRGTFLTIATAATAFILWAVLASAATNPPPELSVSKGPCIKTFRRNGTWVNLEQCQGGIEVAIYHNGKTDFFPNVPVPATQRTVAVTFGTDFISFGGYVGVKP
jgi:hypothetical protein